MAMVPILDLHAGPLPVSVTFKSPSDGGAVILVSGSLRSVNAPTLIGFEIVIDGHVVGKSVIWSNADNVHRATVPVVVKAPQDFNQHTLSLQVMNANSIGDQNDYFTAVLDY